jgi:3-oxoacyl-[acyl-carrier-protein] synthase II
MASQTTTEVVITGGHALTAAPRATIVPARWAGNPAKLQRMDRLCALALVACDGALCDGALAPLDGAAWDGERTAMVLGTAYGCHATNEDYYRGVLAGGPGGASPRLFAYTLPSSPVGEVSIHYGIKGPAAAVTNGLTAGLDAIAAGLRELRQGRADRVLVAAAEVATPLLERLLGTATPLQDGSAALLFERTAQAAQRGATPRGRVLATATSYAAGARASAVAEAARRALAEADVGPGAISRVLGSAADAAAVRALGIEAAAHDEAPETLGAAPLLGIARWLRPSAGLALAVAGDPEGAGSAVILQA